MRRSLLALVAALAAVALPTLARADDPYLKLHDTRIVNVPNSPVAITKCQFADHVWGTGLTVNLLNRTQYDLLNAHVHVYYYDTSNSLMGEDDTVEPPIEQTDGPLSSGDTGAYSGRTDGHMNEPESALGHVTCRIESATFTAHKHWRYGQRWKGKLLPLRSSMIDTAGSPSSFAAHSATSKSKATLRVLAAWNDTSAGMTLVHDRIAITATSGQVTIKPIDVVLRMRMAGGQTLSLPALGTAAPTYQKFNPVSGNDEATPEVDPSSDLGALGSVTVPQGGTAVVVATFVIPGAAADPQDNKQVALR